MMTPRAPIIGHAWNRPPATPDRGHDLAYLANLPDYLADVRRSIHEADLDAIATAKAAAAAKREGRNQRRELPQVKKIQVQTAARTA
jgi:hypothetical protein